MISTFLSRSEDLVIWADKVSESKSAVKKGLDLVSYCDTFLDAT